MKQRLLNFAMMLLMATTSMLTAEAQKTMDVSTFTRIDNDLMARVTKPVRDHDEGKLCALIRVVSNLTDLEVRADALGIVQQEKHAGELWLYVPYGARSLSFSHEGYFPLLYQYALAIEEGTVYELRLASFETNTDAMASNSNTQLFVLTHHPDEATVYIDGVEVPTEYGVFAAMMSKGDHTYKVTADQYADAEGSFTLGDQTVRETATLAPLFGSFQLFTLPDNGFNVSINGEKVGVSPYKSGKLEPGSYKIHIDKEKYYPVDTLLRLREGDNKDLTIRLTSKDDSLFYNRILGGRNVSFGFNAGYLFPSISSSSGGFFTGSPINYTLGDTREDVNYSSKSGFTLGVIADIRLYKNFYLTTGLNFTQIKYTNNFDKTIPNIVVSANETEVLQGDMSNNYEENYTLSMFEIPILASYRLVLTKTSSIHFNLGPYFSYGLSAKMKVSGNSHSDGNVYIRRGLIIDTEPTTTYSNYIWHSENEFDLYSKNFEFTTIMDGEGNNERYIQEYTSNDSPYKRFNFGLKTGIVYELRGFQLGIGYSLQLSNMGKKNFWEGSRIPLLNGQVSDSQMSGYKHRIHFLEIKLGYILRY